MQMKSNINYQSSARVVYSSDQDINVTYSTMEWYWKDGSSILSAQHRPCEIGTLSVWNSATTLMWMEKHEKSLCGNCGCVSVPLRRLGVVIPGVGLLKLGEVADLCNGLVMVAAGVDTLVAARPSLDCLRASGATMAGADGKGEWPLVAFPLGCSWLLASSSLLESWSLLVTLNKKCVFISG